MANNRLILRSLQSPWITPITDITKGSVLTHDELDNNLIYLRGEVIHNATSSSGVTTLHKINGNNIIYDNDQNNLIKEKTYVLTISSSTIVDAVNDDTEPLIIDDKTNYFFRTIGGPVNLIYGFASGKGIYGSTGGGQTVDDDDFILLNADTGSTSFSPWEIASGSFAIRAINPTGLDATGDYAVAQGNNTLASGDTSHAEGDGTIASGYAAHAEGDGTIASGYAAHAEGDGTLASGDRSHAEGNGSTASGNDSHAQGQNTTASGLASHAEGVNTTASGPASHAEGSSTASNTYSHAEGKETLASGNSSHAEGWETQATGSFSHSEGRFSIASGLASHAEGGGEGDPTTASGSYSHAEGNETTASGNYGSHAEGRFTVASGIASHAQGRSTTASGDYSHAEGQDTIASGLASHAEGAGTTASGPVSHAEGNATMVTGTNSHSEGAFTTASGYYAHAEGFSTEASGDGSHAEGRSTTASGFYSHAEGNFTTASGNQSHAEGGNTLASGTNSHAEGRSTTASGNYGAHSEGRNTTASGYTSHAGGHENVAHSYAETVIGSYSTNYIPTSDILFNINDRVFNVGNGTISSRSDALQVIKSGEVIAPSLTEDIINTGDSRVLITKEYFEANAGGGGDTYWTAGTGTGSVKIKNGGNTSVGNYSLSSGQNNTSNGTRSITFGLNNVNTWTETLMFGENNTSTDSVNNGGGNLIGGGSNTLHNNVYYSEVIGQENVVGTLGAGYNTAVIYNSMIFGASNNMYAGRGSGMIGAGLSGGSHVTTIVGVANIDLTENIATANIFGHVLSNPRFIVGNGDYRPGVGVLSRSNAFVVMQSGEVLAPDLSISKIDNGDDKILTTKEYLENNYSNKFGTTLPLSGVSGTTNIDWSTNTTVYDISISGNTTLVDVNLPGMNQNKVINIYVDTDAGTETLTVPGYWVIDPGSDTFDPAQANRLTVECVNGSPLKIYYFIKNLG